MKTKTPLDYEQEKPLRDAAFVLRNKLESCRFFSVGVTGLLLGVAVILAAMLFFCKTAHGGGFVEIGKSTFNKPGDTLWWQAAYPNDFDAKALYLRAGWSFRDGKTFGANISAFNLGGYRLNAIAAMDEPCYVKNGTNSPSICGPTGQFITSGTIRGIGFTGTVKIGPVKIEAGPTIVRQSFSEHVLNHHGQTGNWHQVEKGGGKMLGLHLNGKQFYLSGLVYKSGVASNFYSIEPIPAGVDTTWVVSLGYRF